MSDRTVKVTLQALVADYVSNMRKAKDVTDEVGGAGSKTAKKIAQQKEALEKVGKAGVAFGTVLAAGVALAVAKFAEFDQAMSNVQASTNESAENMALLRQAAIDAGASTVFSATESANAIEELAKAGVSTSDILAGALAGSLDLAAAGQLGVARAAEITATALNQYGLRGDQAAHVSDVLAAGAGKAMGSVEDLANGLKFVGPVAASMGVSLEETTGVLALFAQQGIIGEQAGTSLRGVLSSLTSPSAQARKEIERLGITLYDSQGTFLGLENAAGQLSNAYSRMDGASRDASLGIIFGRETVTAATALYRAGASGVEEWTEAVNDSGFAAEQARQRLDNLKGDLEALQGALDSALIETGSAANDTLRAMVQALTGLVDLYNELPEPIKQSVLVIGGATAAISLAGGAALLAGTKFLEMKNTVNAAGLSMRGVSLTAGAAGLALSGLMWIVGDLASRHAEAQQRARNYADTLEEGTNRVTKATRELAKENLAARDSFLWVEYQSAFDAAKSLGISYSLVADAATGQADALKELERQLQETGSGQAVLAGQAAIVRNAVKGEADSIEEAIEIAEQKQQADRASAETSGSAAESYMQAAEAASTLESELSSLIDTINKANGVGQDAVSANIAYQDALAKVDEQIQKAREGQDGYSLTLDQSTQAGRENLGMLNDMAARSQAAAEAQFALDGNTQAYKATLEAGRQALIDRAMQLGMNADQAAALADQIYRIPSATEWEAIVDTAAAQQEVNRFIWANDGRRINLIVDGQVGRQVHGESIIARARGGILPGPPSKRDNMFVHAASGEFIVNAEATARHRALLEAINSGAPFGGGFAGGGMVPQYASSAPVVVQTPAPSLDGASITGRLAFDADGFVRLIDGQIRQYDEAQDRAVARGRVVR